jgi:xylulokinase/glycerol kinase
MNVLVIDVGTSSMRGILFDQNGRNISEVQELYSANYLENSWVEQNPADWENALYIILKQSVVNAEAAGETIDAISITSQRSSVLAMDHNMNPLGNAIMWQDKRTNYICESMEPLNNRVFELCGSRINPVFSATKMTWIRQECPEVYEKIYKFMVIPDYLIYLMTGEMCTDYTYGSRSLLMNIKTHEWDPELLEMFHVEREKLCDLVEPGSICGYITPRIAELTGCPENVPVITAGGDQQCGAIGQGVVKKGVMSVTTGTGGYLITSNDQVPENLEQDVICNFSSIKGQYILESSVLTCCSAFDWFRQEFFEEASFDEINQMVEDTPVGSNGCLCLPYFMGRSTPDWNNMAKGVFANVTLGTTKQDMLRSLLEGICFEIRNGIDVMNKYVKVSDIYINGGLSNSRPFNEMQANVYDMKIIRRGKSDATARGALLVAGLALNMYADAEEAFHTITKNDEVKVFLPEESNVLKYEQNRAQMNRIYKKMWWGVQTDGNYEFRV